jgi:hypothetical protein
MTSSTPEAAPLTDAEIIVHYQAGTLLPKLRRPADTAHREALHGQLAALHNAGKIDLIALTGASEFQNLDRLHFFTIQQIYYNTIPLLDAHPLAMLEMVQRLVTQGGNDGAATMPRQALRHWIEQRTSRATEIITAAQSDPGIDREVLRDALVARGDLTSVMSFSEVADPRRQAAIAALGSIKPQNQQAGDAAFAVLLKIVGAEPHEDMRFTAIFSAFSLLQYCKTQAPRWVPTLVAAVTAAPSDVTRTALLQGLWQQTHLFQPADVKATLAMACDGDLTAGHLLGMLDATLAHLIGGVYHDLAIDCLTVLLATTGKAMPLNKFQVLEHRLMALDRVKLFALAVRWFATGDQMLCEAISKLIGGVQAQPFDTSLAGFGLTGSQMVVLCHKAIGYMLVAPIVAASFVVAAFRAGDKAAEPELTRLLLQWLLINYGDTGVTYLKGIDKPDTAYEPVRKALKLYRSYEKGLDIKTPIKELLPSSYQRGAVRQNHYVAGREIRKQAERQSVFFGLMHRSTLLYGRKALTYVGGSDKPPVSMEMKTISTSFEMPRLQIIDPVGLEWLMRIFRVSKPK